MATVSEKLNQIWSDFRKAGITDDLSIIEYIARFLVEETLTLQPPAQNLPLHPNCYTVTGFSSDPESETLASHNIVPEKQIPRQPTDVNISREIIKNYLHEAIGIAGDKAKLFNYHVVFRLSSMLPGGRYPTPRHIVGFMQHLAEIEPQHSLADFACGSGACLQRETTETTNHTETVGIDISPEWIRIAWANIALRRVRPNLKIGNSLKFFISEEFRQKKFDRIVMNPPFGEKVDTKLAQKAIQGKIGSRSETALTALALQHLTPGGKAAILVPSGLLSSSSTGETWVREQLVTRYTLEAVITLPEDALQPYSPLQSHLLLVRNPLPQPSLERGGDEITWFWQLEQDGYSSGRSRDLTQKLGDSSASDFPFVEQVFAKRNAGFDNEYPNDPNSEVGVKWIKDEEEQVTGIICQGLTSDILSYKFEADDNSTYLVVEVETSQSEEQVRIPLPSPPESSLDEENLEEDSQEENEPIELEDEEVAEGNSGNMQYTLPQPVSAIAIALPSTNVRLGLNEARLLGIGIQASNIHAPIYDLRPETYIGTPTESRTVDSPAELLTRIYKNQQELTRRIDSLFGRLELPPITDQKIPSPVASEIEPFGILSKEQKQVWDNVRQKTESVTTEGEEVYETALHFTSQEVDIGDTEEITDVTRSTLELLERMGMIIPVAIADPNTKEPLAFYRRVTERDVWKSNNSDSGEESK